MGKVRSFVSTVWFVISDTFKSRKGSVPVDPSVARMIRDTSAVARGTAGGLDASDIDSGTAQRYTKSFDDD